MEIISREQWGARQPRRLSEVQIDHWSDKSEFFVHYSDGNPDQSIKGLQNYFMDSRGYNDIGYSFVVHATSGTIWEGRGWLVRGGHTYGHNKPGIGVCVLGRDRPGVQDVSPAALAAVRWLWEESERRKGGSLRRLGHRDVVNTSCPGEELYNWTHAGMPVDASTTPPDNWTESIVNQLPELSIGAMTPYVKRLQALLNTTDLPVALAEDGQFGGKTDHAVRWYQAAFNVPGSVKSDGTGDGRVGRNTWAALLGV